MDVQIYVFVENTNFMKKYLWILAAVVALVACGKNEKPGVTPVVTDAVSVAPTSLSFTADGTQTESVTVTASGAWTSAKSASWITVNPSSGNGNATVTVSAAFNGGDTRTGKVTFKVGAASAELSVSQSADAPAEGILSFGDAQLSFSRSLFSVLRMRRPTIRTMTAAASQTRAMKRL